jgi:hypothetical protein
MDTNLALFLGAVSAVGAILFGLALINSVNWIMEVNRDRVRYNTRLDSLSQRMLHAESKLLKLRDAQGDYDDRTHRR